MYPAYRGLSGYPYQSTPMPSSQCYYPSWDAAAPQAKEDPAAAGPPVMYESWPQNFGYPVPMQCPNCCNHVQYPPAYNHLRPPCPHFPPPPPAHGHFWGNYPPFPQPSYPVSYAPPPHHTMELPKYEYDKNLPRGFHCCGCRNHTCHVKEGKNVKIEEHEPEVETRKSEYLVPAGANNFTQPILWIPPGYIVDKEQQQKQPRRVLENDPDKQQVSPYYIKNPQWQRRPIETEVGEQQSPCMKKLQFSRRPIESEAGEHVESPRVKKPHQSLKALDREPNVRYGLFPLDMNSIRELLDVEQGRKVRGQESKAGDVKEPEDLKHKEQNTQFPFPIIWMPYGGQGENNSKGQEEKDAGQAPGRDGSPAFKVIPMKFEHPNNEPEKIKTTVGDDGNGVGTRGTEKTSTLKTIPVKQLEETILKPTEKDEDQKDQGVAVKAAERNGKSQSSSPTKKSKLPPICLRVDPPKKKNGNGGSRSPSPPINKKQQESEESKAGSKKEIKVAEGKAPSESKIEISHKAAEDKKKDKHEADHEKKGVKDNESRGAKESTLQAAKKPERRNLSEQEAATIIQSAYRGYDVRRWEPLKKLRQIANVCKEAAEVKKRIEDLESCAGSSIDEKEKTTVAEIIMKLLLKLDTIQGLHPSFRDVRKSVAKELIILQEKLDSIINQKSTPVAQEASVAEEPSKVSSQDEGSEGFVETALGPAELSSQLEGTGETVEELSSISGLDGSSRDIGATDDKSSKVSSQVVSPKVEGESAEACEEMEVSRLNDVSSVQPLTCQAALGGSENEEPIESFPVKMESQNEPQDVTASNSLASTVADSQSDRKEAETDGIETVQEVPSEPQDSSAGTDAVENTTEQVDVASGCQEEQVNLLTEIPPEVVVEDNNEISQMEGDSGTALKGESIESAPSSLTCEALKDNSELAEEDEGLTLQVELPQVIEEGVREQTSEFPSSVILDKEQEDRSVDIKGSTLAIKPESCELQSAKLSSNEAQEVLKPELVGVDVPTLELTVEEAAPAEEGSQVCKAHGASLKIEEDEDTKLSPQTEGTEHTSDTASHEEKVSHDEEAPEFVGEEQERTLDEEDSALDQKAVPGHENVRDQFVGSEAESPQTDTQQPRQDEAASKEQPEGHQEEEQIDRRIVEENEKLREMLERLIASGKKQQDVISNLSGKVKDLEKKLAREKKIKSVKRPRVLVSRASCVKPYNGSLRERPMGVAS